jgi:hypothetical protein
MPHLPVELFVCYGVYSKMNIMKVFLIVLGVALLVFVIAQAFIYKNVSGTEKHKYKVLVDYGDFEVRRYEAALFTTISLNASNYREVSGPGFRVLAGYIFGDNSESRKIAMTSPVVMDINETSRMMFMVPSEFKRSDLPDPNNPDIQFEMQDEKVMAAIEFGGWANDEKIEQHRIKLSQLLDEKGIAHNDNFLFLGYSPPFEVTNRRNEVVVELTGNFSGDRSAQ